MGVLSVCGVCLSILTTLPSQTHSQWWGSARQQVRARTSQSEEQRQSAENQDNGKRKFEPIFVEAAYPDTTFYIQPGRFEILPAVPGLLGQLGSSRNNAREDKSIRSGQEASVFISDKFRPVPAVPFQQQSSVAVINVDSGDVQSDDLNDTNDKFEEVERVVTHLNYEQTGKHKEQASFISAREKRKKFKKCHGRCVQKFCLPIGDISVYEACTANCKDICS